MGQVSSRLVHASSPSISTKVSSSKAKKKKKAPSFKKKLQVTISFDDDASEQSIHIRVKRKHRGQQPQPNEAHCRGTFSQARSDPATCGSSIQNPRFPKNHHRLLSQKIESRRSAHSRRSSATSLRRSKDEALDSSSNSTSWLKMIMPGNSSHHSPRRDGARPKRRVSNSSLLGLPFHKKSSSHSRRNAMSRQDSFAQTNQSGDTWGSLSIQKVLKKQPSLTEDDLLRTTDHSCETWGGLSVHKFIARTGEKKKHKSLLPALNQNSININDVSGSKHNDSSMNMYDVSGNTLSTRVDYSDSCNTHDFECTVRRLPEDRLLGDSFHTSTHSKTPSSSSSLPKSSLRSLSSRTSQRRKKNPNATEEPRREGQRKHSKKATRTCKSDSVLAADRKDNLASLRKEPWNPHTLKSPSFY